MIDLDRSNLMSGGRIDLAKFKAGWVKMPFGPKKAHYLRRTDAGFLAACGYEPQWRRDAGGFIALHPGNFPECSRCISKVARRT
jgi:hypothetical protein